MPLYTPLSVAGVSQTITTSAVTSLGMPSAAKVGDLALIQGLRTTSLDVTDSRFTLVYRRSVQAGYWVCPSLPSLEDVEVSGIGTTAARQALEMVVWTGTQGLTGDQALSEGTANPISFGTLANPQRAAVAMTFGFNDSFAAGTPSSDSTDEWVRLAGLVGRTGAAAYHWTTDPNDPQIPGAGLFGFLSVDAWQTLVLGVELKVLDVVRQYPRDDGLGHSSAARRFPPIKRRRIVGGYT